MRGLRTQGTLWSQLPWSIHLFFPTIFVLDLEVKISDLEMPKGADPPAPKKSLKERLFSLAKDWEKDRTGTQKM